MGKVVGLGLKDYRAHVDLRINNGVKIDTDAIASIKTSGIIGDKYVSISLGGGEHDIADGVAALERRAGARLPLRVRFVRATRQHSVSTYFSSVLALTASLDAVALDLAHGAGVRNPFLLSILGVLAPFPIVPRLPTGTFTGSGLFASSHLVATACADWISETSI